MKTEKSDVVIAGGGLAGLSLAKQLIDKHNDLDITVLEKNTFPRPQAIAKVGESSVEIGADYLANTVGLKEHLNARHLRKFGLRCYFGQADQLSNFDEIGPSKNFGIPAYQIDRGELENHLFDQLVSRGVTIQTGVETQSVNITQASNHCMADTPEGKKTFEAPWLLDASGRRGLLKHSLNLGSSNAHVGNAIWFRINQRIEIDHFCEQDNAWHDQCSPTNQRWLSTNHIMGAGYWMWVIPLHEDITSIGIVMDDHVLQDGQFDTIEHTLTWLEKNQPLFARQFQDCEIMDFVKVTDYSYSCRQTFSDQGWAMTGEAGVFTDPFYSPGSDFIAISNQYIVDLVSQSRAGQSVKLSAAIYQRLYQSIYDSTLSLYTGQYGGFGDRRMMGVKLVWDIAYYWGVLCLLYFRGALMNIDVIQQANGALTDIRQVNQMMQARFRDEATKRIVRPTKGTFMNHYDVPIFKEFVALLKRSGDVDCVDELKQAIVQLKRLASVSFDVLDDKPVTDDERDLLGVYGEMIR